MTVERVAVLPSGNWLTGWPYEFVVDFRGDATALEVVFEDNDGYVGASLHLWLSPTGIQVSARSGTCTSIWLGEHVSGTACLVTDGKSAVLDFQIHDGGTRYFGEALLGRADLGTVGAELARRTSSAPSAGSTHVERVEFADSGLMPTQPPSVNKLEASGLVDAFGRRQGLWTVREVGTHRLVLEASWRNGMPDGLYRRPENEFITLEIGSFECGLRNGQSISWRQSGERAIDEWRHDTLVSMTRYGQDGAILDAWKSPSSGDAYWDEVRELHTQR
jgi:hypothetical protein